MGLPVIAGKEIVKFLLKQGFVIVRQKGSHVQLVKQLPEKFLRVTVPVHANQDLYKSVLRSIIKQAGYNIEEFVKLLGK